MKKDKLLGSPELELTVKQRKFIKRFLELGNGTKAALEVYNCRSEGSAASLANETLRKLENPFKTFLEAKGLSYNDLYETAKGGLQAKKLVTSPTEPDKEVADWPTRHKFMETLGRWLGAEKREETFGVEAKSGGQSFRIIFKRDLE